jgi:hypothetical protein
MAHHVLLTRIQSVRGGKSCLSCPSCLQWFLSAILLHSNFKEMVLLLSDPYEFSTWSQLKAETHQSNFALFHCCEIKSVRWLQRCGELQLKTHQLSLYLQGKEGNGKMHSRDWYIMCKNSFTLRNVQNPLTLMSSFARMNKLLFCWVSWCQKWLPIANTSILEGPAVGPFHVA